ncbi:MULTISPECIES: phage portal protein [unclassified Pseudomonas]|uniref:phage portal protein n=1 Tax=unclassified Pseudomonas TaxID=196821 RepID=UPI002114441B|nr:MULTISPECIES: phage portal protein [unclassified Pseudomonas]
MYADDPRECDAEATLNHYQLQALVLVSSMVAGDVFVASPDQERPGCIFSTRLQLIESDRVGNPNGSMDRVDLVEGVEFDGLGSPVAYHVCSGYLVDSVEQTVDASGWSTALECNGGKKGKAKAKGKKKKSDKPLKVVDVKPV